MGNSAPTNSAVPVITGTLTVGNALSASTGSWSDTDGDSLTYSYRWYRADDASGSGEAVISGATSSTYVVTAADAHKYLSIVVTADDGNGSADQAATSTRSEIANTAPQFTSTAITSVAEDSEYRYSITVTDTDQLDPVFYTASALPSWVTLTIDTTTAVLTGIPGNEDVGDHQVAIAVSDGIDLVEQRFIISVSNTNDAPTVDSSPVTLATEDEAYQYDLVASDVDVNDSVVFSASVLPAWLAFEPSTGLLSGTPSNSDVGDHPVTLVVEDTSGVKVEQSFTVTVTQVNDTLTISTSPIVTATQGQNYSYTVEASDIDIGDNLEASAVILPSWLTLSGQLVVNSQAGVAPSVIFNVTGTPANKDVGEHQVQLKVVDGTFEPARPVYQTFTITVSDVNDAPVVTSSAKTGAIEDLLYYYQFSVVDPDDDGVTLSAVALPNWLAFNPLSGELQGTPTNADNGVHSVILQATDGQEIVTQDFDITVAGTNDLPSFTSSATTSIDEDSSYNYSPIVTDPDAGAVLTMTAPIIPSWLSFDGTILSGIPDNEDVGQHAVTLRLSDGFSFVDQSFTIVVNNTNDTPIIDSVALTEAVEDEEYRYTLSASDVDVGDSLSYSASVLPGWLSFDATIGLLSGTPGDADIGDHSVTLSVSDGTVNVDHNFSILVSNINDLPTGIVTVSGSPNSGELLTAFADIQDDDGLGSITLHWIRDGQELATGDSYLLSDDDIGTSFQVEARYLDARGTPEIVMSDSVGPILRMLLDLDGDGYPDSPADQDGDGIPDDQDGDIDGDGEPNSQDRDVDGDGIPNDQDTDIDGDGLPNDKDADDDGDGIPDSLDVDSDGDGYRDMPFDQDSDGIPDDLDTDIDGDGIPNDEDNDLDGDGIPNGDDSDVDGDGLPNSEDEDDDGDGIPDLEDSDSNADGIPDFLNEDMDGDGIPNRFDTDLDGDGIPNDQDDDIDGDGLSNAFDDDDDGDGVDDLFDDFPKDPGKIKDSDSDGDGIDDNAELNALGVSCDGRVVNAIGVPIAGANVWTPNYVNEAGYPLLTQSDAFGKFSLALPAENASNESVVINHAAYQSIKLSCGDIDGGDLVLLDPGMITTVAINGLEADGFAYVSPVLTTGESVAPVLVLGNDRKNLPLSYEGHSQIVVVAEGFETIVLDNDGKGFTADELDGQEIPAQLIPKDRYYAELTPAVSTADSSKYRFDSKVFNESVNDFVEHDISTFTSVGISASGIEPLSSNAVNLDDLLVSLPAGLAEDMVISLVDNSGLIRHARTFHPTGLAVGLPTGTRQVDSDKAWVANFYSDNPNEIIDTVRVNMSQGGMDTSGLACTPPDATIEVNSLETGISEALDEALYSEQKLVEVKLHLGNCSGGLVDTGKTATEKVLKNLQLTISFNSGEVVPGDFDYGQVHIFQADNVGDMLAGLHQTIPDTDIISIDYVRGEVTFRVTHLSVFSVGVTPVTQDVEFSAGGTGSVSPWFLLVMFSTLILVRVRNLNGLVVLPFSVIFLSTLVIPNSALSDEIAVNSISDGGYTLEYEPWYLFGDLGWYKNGRSRSDIENILNDGGLSGNITRLEDDRIGFSLGVGYEWNEWLFEFGWLNSGDTDLSGNFTVTPGTDLNKVGADAMPGTGSGLTGLALYTFPLNNELRVFAGGGLMAWKTDYDSDLDADDRTGTSLIFKSGVDYPILPRWMIRVGIQYFEVDNDPVYSLNAGVVYRFANRVHTIIDSDDDGVRDLEDVCPGTSQDIEIDINGCPRDSDNDGIVDYLDQCAQTVAEASVDMNGCAIDGDHDDVPDYLDICPGTDQKAIGQIGKQGCPLDTDKDGVFDYVDLCPGTEAEAIGKVDTSGCPLDTDADGIYDYVDQCTRTPEGIDINTVGCSVSCPDIHFDNIEVDRDCRLLETFVDNGFNVVWLEAHFETGSSLFSAEYVKEMELLLQLLIANPGLNVIVEGHADSWGGENENIRLSEERAATVARYMIEYMGVDPSRIQSVGYGESQPIADNNTQNGRALNRRVVIQINHDGK